ncbi:MAG: NADH:flavin oxidoreductase/NADH oxidase [Bacteroidetes bacterium]|nr:NADH:flavin oxidoreductase/NADH oxidase [Bacteroidota bacterium]
MSKLLSPLKIRELQFRNRIFVSPMCQYSAKDGVPNDWHLVHLGSRAVGGAGLVLTEATAVSPEGRISPADLGIWNDEQENAFGRITDFIKSQGSVPGIQLAHAGRKASTKVPWIGEGTVPESEGGWKVIGPSPVKFSDNYPQPKEMTAADVKVVVRQWAEAARRSLDAGFQVAEIHMAHGYLLHQFLSPLSNKRTDEYGGELRNRMRFPLEVAKAVRSEWPENLPVFVRISVTDWVEGGWDLSQSVELAKELKKIGIDLIDSSTGGLVPGAKIPIAPGYQVNFAEEIRKQAGIMTGAIGLITDAAQAENILVTGQADVVFMARELLRDPYFPLHAAKSLGDDPQYPNQYLRAKPK